MRLLSAKSSVKSLVQSCVRSVRDDIAKPTAQSESTVSTRQHFRDKWFYALKQVLPIYIIIRTVALIITSLSSLYSINDFTEQSLPFWTIWHAWNRLDTTHFDFIATNGYTEAYRTAFFPLQPLLIRLLYPLLHSTFLAGIIISNLAALIMMIILYQLVYEDFDAEYAERTLLYLTVFPTAFFFIAAYNESLFLCLVLLCFYAMRHGHWWLAGLFGFFASLTRSAGIFLLMPLCYEYLRQQKFHFKKIRLDAFSTIFLPLGTSFFAVYCYLRFGDLLAFSHAQVFWHRHLHMPWYGMISSIQIIADNHSLNFYTLRNLTDLIPSLLILVLIILSLIGPWHLPRTQWSYCLYAITLYLSTQLVPVDASTNIPLQSVGRLVMEIFPAFIVLAGMGKNRTIHLSYMLISSSLFFFLLTQFTTQRWMV